MKPPSDNDQAMSPSGEESDLRREAIAWVIRLRNSRILPEDRRAFDVWHAQSPAHANVFRQVSDVWDDPELGAAANHAARSHPPLSPGTPTNSSWRWWPYAAAAVAGAAVLLVVTMQFDLLSRARADYYTVAGERRTVQLPDRSTVMLNTQSAIATEFDGSTRHVRLLKGEAFFKVQHDPDRPFIVESQETATRAVGTEFVVRAQEDRDQVTVVEGVVEVTNRHDVRDAKQLTAGFQLQMERSRLGSPRAVDVSTASAWMRGRLVVNGMPLAQVIEEVRRYYPGTIVFLNRGIGETKVTGTYNLSDPPKILSLLSNTFPLHMVSVADRVVILF